MLKIIHKMVLKELFIAFLLTLSFLNSILMVEKLLILSRILSGVGATLFDLAKIILYLQPQLLLLTIPMSLLLSTLLVYGRMNADSEIMILKAIGMDFKKIIFPVMLLGIACFLISISVSFYVGPKSNIKLRDEISKTITSRSGFAIEAGTFNTSFKDIVLIIKSKKSPDSLEKIFIYDNRNKEEPRVIMAKEGRIFIQDQFSIGLYLKDGYINISKNTNTTELFFDKYKITFNLYAESPEPKKAELTPLELLQQTKKNQTNKKKLSLYLELHSRLSLPLTCLLLIFIGTPLSLMAGKSGRLGGLSIGLLIFTLYYIIVIYNEKMVLVEVIPHYLGAWIPSLILGILAIALFRKGNFR